MQEMIIICLKKRKKTKRISKSYPEAKKLS